MPDAPLVLAFDVNETLSDLSAMAGHFDDVGLAPDLVPTWFASVLRDGFALNLSGAPAAFADVAAATLGSLAVTADLNRPLTQAVDAVMAGFMDLDVHPDVARAVQLLGTRGQRLVTLSNGSTQVADRLLRRAEVRDAFHQLLSVEDAGVWKPHPQAYAYAAQQCEVEIGDVMLVAVHPWDIDGAHRAGMRTVWVNRDGRNYPEVFAEPEYTVSEMTGLLDMLDELIDDRQ
jgi:2-haloacid dehalogenase